MGSSQSIPRSVVVNNPDEAGIIQVTDSVVGRLKGNLSEVSKEKPANFNKVSDPGVNVFVSSHVIKKEIEAELLRNDQHWENRLRRLNDGFKWIETALDYEYRKAKKLGSTLKRSVKPDLDSCSSSKESVITCYKVNKHQPLLCGQVVDNFNKSVTLQMGTLLKAK